MKVYRENNAWKITDVNVKDFENIREYVESMYRNELKEMDEFTFKHKAKETVKSIIKNEHESCYIDEMPDGEDYLVVVPIFGFGSVEFPITALELEI